jgi:ubiquinone/menaquinone biosynthesis C-methylase UbiE
VGTLVNSTIAVYRRLQRLLVPHLRHSQYVYEEALDAHVHAGLRWLDAGCGHGIFPSWKRDRGQSLVARAGFVVGMDCDCPSLWENRIVHSLVAGDLGKLPFPDSSFDMVSANMVVEHLSETDTVGQAVFQTLKPGGVFIFHTPNYLNYQTILASMIPQRLKYRLIHWLEQREEKDAFPTHYRLNTPGTIRRAAERNGFVVKELRLVNSTPELFRLGPVVLLELLLIWVTEWRIFRSFRSNIVVVLERPAGASAKPLRPAAHAGQRAL